MSRFAGRGPFRIPDPGERAAGAPEDPMCPKHKGYYLLKERHGWWCEKGEHYVEVKKG